MQLLQSRIQHSGGANISHSEPQEAGGKQRQELSVQFQVKFLVVCMQCGFFHAPAVKIGLLGL